MLRFRRIEIENFVCFDDIVVEPSTDPAKPLTIIRAENGSGKTTFLRAIRWCMYGERGLPGDASRFSLHPAWWHPDDEGIRTRVTIEFDTDGSTRHLIDGSPTTTTYQLVRSVTTIGKAAARDDEPDFRRINEQTQLMVREGDGTWTPHTAGVDAVVEQLLPWGLRDFFVLDADEVADYVGGSENKTVRWQDVIDKTTGAVHSLLGIDVFKQAANRVEELARMFGSQATKAIGDSDLDSLQAELDQLRLEESKLSERIDAEGAQRSELQDLLQQRRDELETELKGVGAAEELGSRLAANRKRHEELTKERAQTLSLLAAELESSELLASLATQHVSAAYSMLKPLYDRGQIPLKHLNFVRELLKQGRCVCGQDLTGDGPHRRHVERRIMASAEQEERANYLGQLHDAAKSLWEQAKADAWEKRRRRLAEQLATLDEKLSQVALERREIEVKLDAVDQEKIQVIRDEIAVLETQLTTLNRNLGIHEAELPPLKRRIDSLGKQISQRQRNERAAADKRAAQAMAELVAEVLARAYSTIQREQVAELSLRMNALFAQMAKNVSDDDLDEVQKNKATLRMIAEVGIRPVEGKSDEFEIYALNSRGRAMPPIEINGASRRVLALSFVLALCTESQTRAPLVADSLLNFMSGTVRRNTLRVAAKNSSQPILLLTPSDLEAPSEVEIIEEFGVATYTLTGQWDAIEAGEGGDVVHWTEHRSVALLCTCGPREYCDICERVGQADSPRWSRRRS